ncbi:hypothetical protein [Streptomyces violascens]|uniref:Uncharacterized protein n=1 Tax=Streptomyces violascens TaxID=67381 RepID=A0ABQ3QF64_9ACTN|nr:hypothetical protein [Streptomyces violascens]GGT86206.1 hypothetical protein GCM10010289_02450 [Streptomyces violascens]GHI35910.1 hypothetical protein Sviol_03180 [Streptomyces violascens]
MVAAGFAYFPSDDTEAKSYVKTLSAASFKAHDAAVPGCVDSSQHTAEKEYGIPEANSEWARVDG